VRGYPVVILCIVVAAVFAIAAVLYALGMLRLFASGTGVHYKHAILMAGLAIIALGAASFARPRTA
jgi:dipeptide/tripeptide permease